MRMSNEEYAAFVDSLSPRSPIWGDLLRAGLVGGAICVVGQALVNLYEHWGASAATAATWCSITLVFLGALLTGLGVPPTVGGADAAGRLGSARKQPMRADDSGHGGAPDENGGCVAAADSRREGLRERTGGVGRGVGRGF